jgi:hypothetical protein
VQFHSSAITRVTQLELVALGLGLAFLSESAGSDLAYLVGWDLLVGSYLAIGFVVARSRRTRPDPARPGGTPAEELDGRVDHGCEGLGRRGREPR